MPIYEYHCQACGHDFEVLQKITDNGIPACVHCGKAQVERLVSAAGFQLKGTGWYATDFKNPQTAAKKETTSAVKTETKSEAKTMSATENKQVSQKTTSAEKGS